MINEDVKDVISGGKLNMVTDTVQKAMAEGATSEEILDSMMEGMDEVGDKFQNNDIYVPEMLIAAKTMERGVTLLKPSMSVSSNGSKYGKFIIGTVQGDLHDIGKNLVAVMVQSAGFDVIDLGIDVPPEDFIKAIKANPDCKVVGISALLTFTLGPMQETVKMIKDKFGDRVKVMVGGAPVNEQFARQIGADAYTKDAVAASKMARELARL